MCKFVTLITFLQLHIWLYILRPNRALVCEKELAFNFIASDTVKEFLNNVNFGAHLYKMGPVAVPNSVPSAQIQ